MPEDASSSVAALCVTRSADGRWLAGRRATWLASWAGRWALGAGGAVEVRENPAETLLRELREEWSVAPARIRAEALLCLPQRLVMFVGQAWLPDGAEVTPDDEHDEFEWWPRDVERWPARAEQGLRRMAAGSRGERRSASALRPTRPLAPEVVLPPEVDLVHAFLRLMALLICAFAAGKPEPATFVLGLTHGLLWIFMSLACITAARFRIVSLRLAVAVAVLGGIGPFFGSYEFIREQGVRR